MHTQQTRIERLTGVTLAATLIGLGLITVEDVNDQEKIADAADKLKGDTDMMVAAAATNALQNGIEAVANAYIREPLNGQDIENFARAVAQKKFQFQEIEKLGYKYNADLLEALQQGEVIDMVDEVRDIDVQDQANILRCLDAAFTALQLAGIPTEILKRNFTSVGLNGTLHVIGDIVQKYGQPIEA